ncbi:MAG: NAD(P)/FAD-dependent oxidoreductase [Kiritimatiellaeota bacterium]|nr:NAD(P)/FAD-dependent oxidoreductase [Kiritimatiellota bacterium]
MQKNYDLCVIGGGPSGYAAAMRAVDFGKAVLLVERNRLGGTGIFDGALSSKTMWELSNKVKIIRGELGVSAASAMPFAHVRAAITAATDENSQLIRRQLDLIQERTQAMDFIRGTASFVSPTQLRLNCADGSTQLIRAKHTIIAAGSRPRLLPEIPVDEKVIVTSNGILHFDQFPKSIVIVGGGIIGCEFASMFANFGQTRVSMIERESRLLPFEDEDVSRVVTQNLTQNGVTVHERARLVRLAPKAGGVEYEIADRQGERQVLWVEKALVSVGRIPNIEDLQLQNAQVRMTEYGIQIPDNDTQTNIPNIHAVGDISGHVALVSVGEREARHAVVSLFANFKAAPIRYKIMSSIMFLAPEVALVGANEQTLRQQNTPYRVAKVDFSVLSRAIAMRKTRGFFKLLVSDDDEMKVLGMRAVGEHASDAIQVVALVIYLGKGIAELSDMIFPYPSIVEGIQTCTRLLMGKAVFKPDILPDKVQCYRYVNGQQIPIFNQAATRPGGGV